MSSAYTSGRQKEHNESQFGSCSFYVCYKKVEVVKEEGIRVWSKHFYVLARCHIDFMLHFIGWSVNVGCSSMCDDHTRFLTLSKNYCKLSLVTSHDNDHLLTSLTVWHRTTNLKTRSQKLPQLFHNADLSSGTAENRAVCTGLSYFQMWSTF